MKQAQIAARIDARVKKAVNRVCKARGLKIGRFIEEALLDKLEEMQDAEDVRRIRFEPTRPLADLLEDLKLDGEL